MPARTSILPLLAFFWAGSASGLHGGSGGDWIPFYDAHGFAFPDRVSAWVSPKTHSERLREGLRISDPSTARGSGRFYSMNWQADPRQGGRVEVRLRTLACSAIWGVSLLVADGVHEQGITFFPDHIECSGSGLTARFRCAGDFHTYEMRFRGTDFAVFADGTLVIDGKGRFTTPVHGGRNRIGFGSGASGAKGDAIWEYVRFQGPRFPPAPPARPRIPGLDIRRGVTRVILHGQKYVSLFRFADGEIAVGHRRSSDGGKTWHAAPAFSTGAYQFPDGEIIQLGFKTFRTDSPGVFRTALLRSKDGGRTVRHETARLVIPEATGGTDDTGKPSEGPACDHAIVGLSDGSVLAGMYGYFKSDRVPCPTFPKQWKFYKYRTFVVRSTDRGRTWHYRATVAYDPKIGLESFCEPDLLRLPNGRILCFMRTGGSGGKHTPLYMNHSDDDGRTWSRPRPIADRGVWPNACRMRSGVLALTYGRPGNWLSFSLDSGRSWTPGFCFYPGENSTNYNSVEEIAPGRLLVVWDRRVIDAGGRPEWQVVGTDFTVQRK